MGEKKRQGIKLYYDLFPALQGLTNEEKGILFTAIMDYAEYDIVPEFDGALKIAWASIQDCFGVV